MTQQLQGRKVAILVHDLFEQAELSEPLRALTGTTTFGDLAVDFFFVISGYLVAQSLARSRSIGAYLLKRVRRIYPGFVVAVLLSIALGVACDGRWRWPDDAVHLIVSLATLKQPLTASAFGGNAYALANGSLWTIQYEFACYLLPVAFLVTRLHERPAPIIACSVALILCADAVPHGSPIGALHNPLRLSGTFLAGMAFRLLLEREAPKPALAIAGAGLCALALFWAPAAGLGIAYPGGYALLALCLHRGRSAIARLGRRNDASYGTYLYGWPVESFVVWLIPGLHPVLVFLVAAPPALALGWASWRLVEAPFLKPRVRATIT